MNKLAILFIPFVVLAAFSGCIEGQKNDELQKLKEENLRLQRELEMQKQTTTPLPMITQAPTTQPPVTTPPTTTPTPTAAQTTTSPTSSPQPSVIDVTGLWIGTAQSSKCSYTKWSWTASLYQSGTKVTGSFNAEGQTFDVSGSLSGTKLFIASTRNDVPTSLSGTIDGALWSGTYSATYPNSFACPYEKITQGTFEGRQS